MEHTLAKSNHLHLWNATIPTTLTSSRPPSGTQDSGGGPSAPPNQPWWAKTHQSPRSVARASETHPLVVGRPGLPRALLRGAHACDLLGYGCHGKDKLSGSASYYCCAESLPTPTETRGKSKSWKNILTENCPRLKHACSVFRTPQSTKIRDIAILQSHTHTALLLRGYGARRPSNPPAVTSAQHDILVLTKSSELFSMQGGL